jgi:hypothetical protein
LGLTVQTLAVQTHVHRFAQGMRAPVSAVLVLGAGSNAVAAESAERSTRPSRDDNRGNDDPSNCPLCQAFAHFSQFTHGVALFSIPLFLSTTHGISLDGALPSFAAIAHSWYSRGPPLHTTNILAP